MGESHDLSCDWTESCDSSGQGSIDLMVSILERSIYISCFLVMGAPSPWAPAMTRPTFPWSVMDMSLQWASYGVMEKSSRTDVKISQSLLPSHTCIVRPGILYMYQLRQGSTTDGLKMWMRTQLTTNMESQAAPCNQFPLCGGKVAIFIKYVRMW